MRHDEFLICYFDCAKCWGQSLRPTDWNWDLGWPDSVRWTGEEEKASEWKNNNKMRGRVESHREILMVLWLPA